MPGRNGGGGAATKIRPIHVMADIRGCARAHQLRRPRFSLYLRRSFAQSMGYSGEMLAQPVVGIADTQCGFNNCHRHFPELIEAVKRGVLAAGALPIEFPDDLAGRGVPQPDQPEVPQSDVDRHRGDDPRPADGRGGAGGRLRQDRAGAADGRGLGGPAGRTAGRRADDDRRATAASASAPAPIAGGSGRAIAPARSTPPRSTRSRASSPPRPAPAP